MTDPISVSASNVGPTRESQICSPIRHHALLQQFACSQHLRANALHSGHSKAPHLLKLALSSPLLCLPRHLYCDASRSGVPVTLANSE